MGFAIATGGLDKECTAGGKRAQNTLIQRRARQRIGRQIRHLHPLLQQIPDQLAPLETVVGRLEFVVGGPAFIEWFHALPHDKAVRTVRLLDQDWKAPMISIRRPASGTPLV